MSKPASPLANESPCGSGDSLRILHGHHLCEGVPPGGVQLLIPPEHPMPERGNTTELVITAATIAALGLIVWIASARGASGLSEMYGGTDQFRFATLLAISGHRWAPFAFGGLLVGFLWAHSRPGTRGWASWSALSIAGLTTALVLYGVVLPFASTTFRMGNH